MPKHCHWLSKTSAVVLRALSKARQEAFLQSPWVTTPCDFSSMMLDEACLRELFEALLGLRPQEANIKGQGFFHAFQAY